MQIEIIISGSSDQGTLLAGMVLARAGMNSGKYVTWTPGYGLEAPGYAAYVTIIISDEEIGSPLVRNPGIALVLNQSSLEKYEPLIKSAGVLVYNSSLIVSTPQRNNIKYVAIRASEIASGLGEVRVANMVALGALVAVTSVVSLTAVSVALRHYQSDPKYKLLAIDEQALKYGAQQVGLRGT